ncbi:NADPH:quinone reductase [Halonotius pteroides]|uniref:NADPH:quinone reductase n=1 Tax=Halonotius pteroides TaxID=268735 RepID=A0A3A6Q5Y7_9EURY|nr:NADPH:quinone reductase [Halonotius pteroides]RJX51933.1 NADPH:quinone reductase [Halonotius pteroides]
MRAVRFHSHGGTDVLQVDEIDRPEPAADEVLIVVDGAAVNPVDTYFREGSYEPFTLPMIPGIDAAGEISAVGDDVTGFSEGDTVMATGIGKAHYGGYAEYAAIPDDRVVTLLDGVDTVEAGAAGVAAVTAWRALIDHANLQLGDCCLIHGGSGGVGHVAVQIAAAAGAEVITTASPGYHDELGELGADHVFDYHRDDLADAIVDASDGGADVILDHRMHEYLQLDADVAATGCRVVGIGEKEQSVGFNQSAAVRRKDLQLTLMSMFNTPDLRDPLRDVSRLLASGDLDIEIAQQYDLGGAAEAQRAVLEESFLGKLVVTP